MDRLTRLEERALEVGDVIVLAVVVSDVPTHVLAPVETPRWGV